MPPPSSRKKIIDCTRCWCISLIGVVILSVAAFIIGVVAIQQASWTYSVRGYSKSQELSSAPFQHHIQGGGSVIALTLPSDLSNYAGVTYHIRADSIGAHTITIEGGSSASWNAMGHKVATLGGAVGDGFDFYVVNGDTINVVYENNVAFS